MLVVPISFDGWMAQSKEEILKKLFFCLKLGNPIPCEHIEIFSHLVELEYIERSERLSIRALSEHLYIYTVHQPLSIMVVNRRHDLARTDHFLISEDNKTDHTLLISPNVEHPLHFGDAKLAFHSYKYKNGYLVDKSTTHM